MEPLPENVWGSGRLTARPPTLASSGGWQAACKHHRLNEKTGCKKFFRAESASEADWESAKCRARHWLNMAEEFSRKRDHAEFNPQPEDVPPHNVLLLQRPGPPAQPVMTDEDLDWMESCMEALAAPPDKVPGAASSSHGAG